MSYFSSIMGVMEKNMKTWQDIPALTSTYDRFVRNCKKMDDLKQNTPGNLQVYIDEYSAKRSALIGKLLPFLSAAAVIGYDRKNQKLEKLAGIQPEKLETLKDKELLTTVKQIMKAIAPSGKKGKEKIKGKPVLSEYGITDEQVQNIQSAIEEMKTAAAAIRSAEKAKRDNQLKAKNLIQENNTLLKKKLDRLVATFQFSQGAFYKEYQDVRTDTTKIAAPAEKTDVNTEKKPAPGKTTTTTAKKPAPGKTAATTSKKQAPRRTTATSANKTGSSTGRTTSTSRKTSGGNTSRKSGGA